MALVLLLVLYQLSNFAHSVPLAPALYIFGDSLADSGNNNFLPTHAKANYQPYGVNFAAGTTGRFTNGKTTADFIAEFLEIPYPPPHMSLKNSSPIAGVNYASGSCGILPETGKLLGKCLTLDDQIGLFETMAKSNLPKQLNSDELNKHLSNSIYLFFIGSNDYIVNYLDTKNFDSSKRFTPEQFAQFLLAKLTQSLQRIYDLGARKIVIFELLPIGCMPAFAKTNPVHDTERCMEQANQLVTFFNDNLGAMLQTVPTKFSGSKFVYGNTSWISYDIIINPSKYDLTDTSNACCTTLNNGTSVCIPGEVPCPNPQQFYFFDAFHPSEAVNSILASHCINDSTVCSPTISELIKM